MIFSCPKEAFPEQYTLTVEVEGYNWSGELNIDVNDESKLGEYFDSLGSSQFVFDVIQGDKVDVYTMPGADEAYVRSYSGLSDVSSSDNSVTGTVQENVHIIVSDNPPGTR